MTLSTKSRNKINLFLNKQWRLESSSLCMILAVSFFKIVQTVAVSCTILLRKTCHEAIEATIKEKKKTTTTNKLTSHKPVDAPYLLCSILVMLFFFVDKSTQCLKICLPVLNIGKILNYYYYYNRLNCTNLVASLKSWNLPKQFWWVVQYGPQG